MDSKPRGVSLSPKSMVDSVADWPLHRVVEHLRKKEKEEKDGGRMESDCRMFYNSSIKFFNGVVDELASDYGVTRGKMCRWLSYHAIAIAREDILLGKLTKSFDRIRRVALMADDPDMTDIVEAKVRYSPKDASTSRGSMYVYSSWVSAEFDAMSRVCAVYPSQIAQIFIVRSILTCDLPSLVGVAPRLQRESDRWSIWMDYRLLVMDMASAMWGDK